MPEHRYFITGIGTGVGKTIVSAIFTEALKAAYWKPVQAGIDPPTDSELVSRLVSGKVKVHPERHRLKAPMSPHAAAEREGISIELDDFSLPSDNGALVVEGAGGLLVPLNSTDTILDMAQGLGLPLVVVSRHYLGSINHSLLTLETIRSRGMEIAHLVFIGSNPETESVICAMTGIRKCFRIPEAPAADRAFVLKQARRLRQYLDNDHDTWQAMSC